MTKIEFHPHVSFEAPANSSGDPDDPIYIEKLWYKSLTKDEQLIERLVHPTSARDYLLRIRAIPLLDHTRLYRVALKRAKNRNSREVLYDEYQEDFQEYLALLSEVRRMIAEDVPAGYVLAPFYDAICLQTEGGKVIVISEVLRYFLYFMTLGNPDLVVFGEVPIDVQGSALVIATRIMGLNETLDFDLDPRGVVPKEIDEKIRELVTWQMRFVIGHEYAHHGLGHVRDETTKIRIVAGDTKEGELTSYRRSWDDEFEADLHSIVDVEDRFSRVKLIQGAVLFFLHIYFHEHVSAAFDPEFAAIDTHPPTEERLRKIVEGFGAKIDIDEAWLERALINQSARADNLIKHFADHPNLLAMYGSVYLGTWKGPELVDRIDY